MRFDRTRMGLHRAVVIAAAMTALVCLQAGLATTAHAARPPLLIQFPGDGAAGTSAGRFGGINIWFAVSPTTGNVYAGDILNGRINVFSAWGQFIRAFGWNVNASSPAEELQVCTEATGCKKGTRGTGVGQIDSTGGGIVVGPSEEVYVVDRGNGRVQKFSAAGEILLEFGNGSGSGDGQFPIDGIGGDLIGLSLDGETIYVGDKNRIQIFGSDGGFKGQITFKALHEDELSFPEEGRIKALEVDPNSGALYVSVYHDLNNPKARSKNVYRINPDTGAILGILKAPTMEKPTALAVDSDSNVYAVDNGDGFGGAAIFKFDAAGNLLIPDGAETEAINKEKEEFENQGFTEDPFEYFGEQTDATDLIDIDTNGACGAVEDDIYVSHSDLSTQLGYIRAYGPPPQDIAKCPPPPPLGPPVISAQYATSAGTDSAVLKADINPRFALDATYYVQYGTGKCSEGGCTTEKPLAPGAGLTAKVADAPVTTAGVVLPNLDPGTEYHYRFVAESGGGGPVEGVERSFTTFPVPRSPLAACVNQAFRTGPSTFLPDCRAYELVSPPDRTPAGDIVPLGLAVHAPADLNQSATDGEKLAYTSQYAFADSVGAPPNSEYIATRVAGKGWSTHAISPPRGPTFTNNNGNLKLDIEEKAFTPDLCTSWLMHVTDTLLSEDAIPGFVNLYKRRNCGPDADRYDSISVPQEPLPGAPSFTELQGFSSDGSRSVFRATARLTADAPDLGEDYEKTGLAFQAYWESGGLLRFLCVLPNGDPYVGACSAGTAGGDWIGRHNTVATSVSADATRVYWSAQNGPLYLRENAHQEQSAVVSGKCTEEEKACTYPVSSGAGPAQFWGGAVDGSKALYTQGGETLREYDAETRKSRTITQKALGVAGASEDLSRFYFGSRERIGGEGVEGQPNLYASEEGETSLVTTLPEEDLLGNPVYLAIAPFNPNPIQHGARVTPDGQHLLFASAGGLTGYDNRDAVDGKPNVEVYRHDLGTADPVCISCNPTGVRPSGRQFLGHNGIVRRMAALIPAANSQLHTPRALSADGDRAFFESFEALVPRDVNGRRDVYQWTRAADEAACKTLGADLYVPSAAGCLSLISSGEDAGDSEFIDASVDSDDVFIRTAASLVPDDHGLIDIYDARVGGGFAPTPPIAPACEGEACQGTISPPADRTPASATFHGPGNASPPGARQRRCTKGKRSVRRAGRTRCVSKKRPARKRNRKHRKRRSQHRRSVR